jgi:chromate transport protein ChrA
MNNTWILMAEARRRLLLSWGILATPVFLLMLLQFFNGKYEGIEATAWGWLGGLLLPGLLLLYFSSILNRHPAKLIHPAAFRALWAAVVAFLVTVAYSLLTSQSTIDRQNIGLDQFFMSTLAFLLPFSAIVLIGLWLFFFKKDNIFKPNPQIIIETAGKKAEEAERKGLVQRARCYQLVAADDVPAAFDLMRQFFTQKGDTERVNETVMQQNRHTNLLKERDMGLVDAAAAQLTLNQIVSATLNLIGQMGG